MTYLSQAKNLENLLRESKLVAYYLLDTDEEKFALFFERSNSKGLQLNFIDILAAKLYAGFNLRSSIEEFEEENPGLKLNREVLVRAISFEVSQGKDISRNYILSKLTHQHFVEHWKSFTTAYKSVYDFLTVSKLLIHPTWIPYENMVLPLMAFASQLRHHDFSQISANQSELIKTWYWLAIFSRRYSSAANTGSLEDAQSLKKAAKGDFSALVSVISKLTSAIIDLEDLYTVNRKYDSVYKGVLNLVNFDTGGYQNFENGNLVSVASSLEDHHIFPNDYLRKNWKAADDSLDLDRMIDCVINRTLIPKLSNVKVSNKPPSKYLKELETKNENLRKALASHLISKEVLDGALDDNYEAFLKRRGRQIVAAIKKNITDARAVVLERHGSG